MSGEHATLAHLGVFPYCAMMQVAKEDTHANYVVCRGFDTRIGRFIDYESGNANKPGIPVAKPFGKRFAGTYQIAQIFGAVLPLQTGRPSPTSVPWRTGQNPGVSATTAGHPADLNEVVDDLSTDEGILINWMLLDSGGSGPFKGTLDADMCTDTATISITGNETGTITANNSLKLAGALGDVVIYSMIEGSYEIINVEHVLRDIADDWRISGLNYDLHEIPVSVILEPPSCEVEEWVTKATGTNCP